MQLSDRIGRRVKLQDLHVLMTVAQSGSMGKAAQSLNTSQPNVSRSIAELEQTLGVRLLDRHRQGVEPTEYGRALLECGAAVFDDLRQGIKSIEFLTHAAVGEVRVGAIPPIAASLVTTVVDRLSQRYPRIVFHVAAADTDKLHRDLGERGLDLLIARRFGSLTDVRENFEFLFDDPYVVVVGTNSPWTRRRRVALAELAEESWVMPVPENPFWSATMEAFRAHGIPYPRTTVFTSLPDVRMALLATGRYLTILPASALRFPIERPELRVLPVELPMARIAIGVVTLKNRSLSPTAKLFMETARDVARQWQRAGDRRHYGRTSRMRGV